jgi:hypothetical protein
LAIAPNQAAIANAKTAMANESSATAMQGNAKAIDTIQAAVYIGRCFFGKNHQKPITNVIFFKANPIPAP